MAEPAVIRRAAAGARVGTRPLLIAAAVLAAVAAVSYWAIVLRGIESTNDAFVDGHLVFLSSRVGGQIAEVRVEENQHVNAGDVLVRLDPIDFETRVARARADLDMARNRLAQTAASAEAAAAHVRAVEVRLHHEDQELQRERSLFTQSVSSRAMLDTAMATRDGTAAELRAAHEQETAERAALGNQAPVRQAEAALHEAELALGYTTVVAPFDGVVGKKSAEVGANVSPAQPLIALAEDAASWVTANFKETQIEEMNPGDPATVTVDAFPDTALEGHVESIAPATGAKYALLPPDNATGNFTKVVQRVPVRIALDERSTLPVGLSVNVRVRVR